jgi:hypothetical protein
MWYYLRRMKLSHQKAARYYLNQDKEEIRLFAHILMDTLVSLPLEAKLIFIDEFSICTRPTTYYMWGQAGEQPQINSDEKHRTRTNGFVSVDAISGQITLWQSRQAKSEQVAEFCFKQAQKAQQEGFCCLTIVLDNNKTHLKKMKQLFEDKLTEAQLNIQVSFMHTARYAPKYNLAEYMICLIRRLTLHHLPADFTLEQVCQRMDEMICQQTIQTKEQVWNTIDHILHAAILGNYSFK